MNKKAQIAQVFVFVVIFVMSIFTIAMFEKESNFISDTTDSLVGASSSPVMRIISRLIVPAFFLFSILGVFFVLRGAL